MEFKVSPEKPEFTSSDIASDPEDKEISEAEDDDRNHKHRKRETHSHSLEDDFLDQGLKRPYRKRNKPLENGLLYRGGDRQRGENWRNSDSASYKDFPMRLEKRRLNQASFSKPPLELHQRIRESQAMSGEFGLVRGRGMDPNSWGIHGPRVGLVDIPSQIVQPGCIPSALYAGRGMSSVSNTPSTSWNAFGLVPGIPNRSIDPLHPLGLPGPFRPAINPMNIGILRQRCRDFEERGFCLRGDMCPMEHGVNRIVVDDVQSLSQFNLPVARPGSQLLEISPGQEAVSINYKNHYAKNSKPGISEDVFESKNGALGGSTAGTSDVYDPDQPLWMNSDPETSAVLHALNQSTADGTESFLDVESSARQKIDLTEGFNEEPTRKNATTSASKVSSVWGKVGGLKRNSEAKGNFDSVGNSSSCLKLNSNIRHEGKQMRVHGNTPLVKESSLQRQSDSVSNIRSSRKALRTVFVSGIPLEHNRREALLLHFQKFGEVIDIHIPANSERAFVQFSKIEEAEAALQAPDAVMGNRFIKLWWAKRDNIPDDRISGSCSAPVIPRGLTNRAPSHPFVLDKEQESPLVSTAKVGNTHVSVAQRPVHDNSKTMVRNGPIAPPPQQKLENLELLKEQLRKKQEMLDQKRNEFRNMLDKLEKQVVGSKDVTVADPSPKRLRDEASPNHAKSETTKPSVSDSIKTKNSTSTGPTVLCKSTSSANVRAQQPLKPSFWPPAPSGTPFTVNRFKLDNRPTTFRITSPLPAGLANVAALKEHFSAYGELSSVELEESSQKENTNDASVPPDVTALVSFTTRHFTEKAVVHGKSWQGHELQFKWVKTSSSGKEGGGSGKVPDTSNVPSDANAHTGEINERDAVLRSEENGEFKDEASVECGGQDNDL